MQPIYTTHLLTPDSTGEFRSIELNPSLVESARSGDWSIRSYVLHGGLQEGVQVVEVNNGLLSFSILPTRGMGIWKGRCGAINLGWDSPVKDPVHPAFVNLDERRGLGWLNGFNEWVVRCGLNSMGPPGIDRIVDSDGNATEIPLTLHGKIANLPARSVSIEVTESALIVRGEVDETTMFGPALRLNTEIRTDFGSGGLTIADTVTNLGDCPVEHEILYHINYGPPILGESSRILAPVRQIAPRNSRAAEGIAAYDRYGPPEVGFVEQVYFYHLIADPESGETLAMLRNPRGDQAAVLRYRTEDLPCFIVWKNTGGLADGYVTGLEPATNFPNARQVERENGRLITLAGGESRTIRVSIETLGTTSEVDAAVAEIEKLQALATATIHPTP